MARATRCIFVLVSPGGGAEEGVFLEEAGGGKDKAASAAEANGLRGVCGPLLEGGERAGLRDNTGGRKDFEEDILTSGD